MVLGGLLAVSDRRYRKSANTVGVAHTITYAQKIAENRPANLTAALDKEFEDRKTAEKRAKIHKHEDWVKRQLERKQREEDYKQREEDRKKTIETQHAIAMFDKYGTNWHNYVFMTDEDCDTADKLRRDAQEKYFQQEEETARYCREQDELQERLKRTLSPEEYQRWEDEDSADYLDCGFKLYTSFPKTASPAAVAYFFKCGRMLPDGDFVSKEWGAERKIDKVHRERSVGGK
jgi:hypothetical protein